MQNLSFIGVPILMLSDYYLTLIGNIYKKKKYGEHFITETYELNPIWRKDVDNPKWINYKHLLAVISITAYFYLISEFLDQPLYYQFMIGFFYVSFGMINGRHLNNYFLFKYIIKHPNEITGKLYLDHLLVLKMSQFQLMVMTVPLILLTFLEPNVYLFGGLFGCLVLYITHFSWIRKHKRHLAKQK